MPPINWAPAKRSFVGKRRSDGALRTIPELKNNSGIVSGAESAPTWQRGWDSKSVARQACTRLLANIACIRLFFDALYLISGFLLWVLTRTLSISNAPDKTGALLVAERVGFEPTDGYQPSHDFESCAFNQLSHLSKRH